jgi:four helix bundle protein
MRNFKQLKIWEKGLEIAVQSIQFTKSLPGAQKFILGDQISRAAISIPSNIAEGSSRRTEKDYSHFIRIALGSSYELETQILIADKSEYGNSEERASLLMNITEEQRMLSGFLFQMKT